jgi:hypothetical protein
MKRLLTLNNKEPISFKLRQPNLFKEYVTKRLLDLVFELYDSVTVIVDERSIFVPDLLDNQDRTNISLKIEYSDFNNKCCGHLYK